MAASEHRPYEPGGRIIRERRESARLTRAATAALLAGVAAPLYGNWEDGHRRPNPEQFYPLASALFSDVTDALECARAFGLEVDVPRLVAAVAAHGSSADQPHALRGASRSSGVLRGSAVKALLRNRFRGTIRRGLPILRTGTIPPWRHESDPDGEIDARILRVVSDGLSQVLPGVTLAHGSGARHMRLSDVDVYLVGDESFAEYSCHADNLLIVSDQFRDHDGRLLIEHNGMPYVIPHFRGRDRNDVEGVLGPSFADLTILGAVVAATRYREQLIHEQPIVLSGRNPLFAEQSGGVRPRSTPSSVGSLRVGIPPWPDTLLIAFDVLRAIAKQDATKREVEFVVRDSFAQLRADFRAGMLDMLLGPPELWKQLTQRNDESAQLAEATSLYSYIGNALYPHVWLGPSPIQESLYRDNMASGLPSRNAAATELNGKRIQTYQANDDHYLLARFLLAVLEQKPALLSAGDIDYEQSKARIERELGVKIEELAPEQSPDADFLWWAVTVPPGKYSERPVTRVAQGVSPVTEVSLIGRTDPDGSWLTELCKKAIADRPKASGLKDEPQYAVEASRFLNLHLANKVPSDFGRLLQAILPAAPYRRPPVGGTGAPKRAPHAARGRA